MGKQKPAEGQIPVFFEEEAEAPAVPYIGPGVEREEVQTRAGTQLDHRWTHRITGKGRKGVTQHGLLDERQRIYQTGGELSNFIYWKNRWVTFAEDAWRQFNQKVDWIEVIDHDTRQPLACRMHLRDAAGRPLKAPRVPYWHDHFVLDGAITLKLPKGEYDFVLERGLEYLVRTGHFTMDDFSEDTQVIDLQRFADLAADPHMAARGAFVEADGVTMQGLVARLSATPGAVRWAGRPYGADTEAVLAELDARASNLDDIST